MNISIDNRFCYQFIHNWYFMWIKAVSLCVYNTDPNLGVARMHETPSCVLLWGFNTAVPPQPQAKYGIVTEYRWTPMFAWKRPFVFMWDATSNCAIRRVNKSRLYFLIMHINVIVKFQRVDTTSLRIKKCIFNAYFNHSLWPYTL